MPSIKAIKTRKIINSAAKYTIETAIMLDDGNIGISSIPGGLSRGSNEAYIVKVEDAIDTITNISPKLIYKSFTQQELDEYLIELDGSENKSKLGGNVILSLSIAYCKAKAKSEKLNLFDYINKLYSMKNGANQYIVEYKRPEMMMLILEGGLHGSGKATIQEFMVIVNDTDSGINIYNNVKEHIHKEGYSTNVGSEGAFSPKDLDNEHMLKILSNHIGKKSIALDIAANSFKELKANLPEYESLLNNYPIISLEDVFSETNLEQWQKFNALYGDKINVVTDDLTTTNTNILTKAIEQKLGNTIIIKPNQIGSVSETLEVIKLAKDNKWKTVVSHRGTDTNDDFIADLAIGTGADYTKFGAPARGERVSKYNRLNHILELLNI